MLRISVRQRDDQHANAVVNNGQEEEVVDRGVPAAKDERSRDPSKGDVRGLYTCVCV